MIFRGQLLAPNGKPIDTDQLDEFERALFTDKVRHAMAAAGCTADPSSIVVTFAGTEVRGTAPSKVTAISITGTVA